MDNLIKTNITIHNMSEAIVFPEVMYNVKAMNGYTNSSFNQIILFPFNQFNRLVNMRKRDIEVLVFAS